jgi:hypothetical protein
MIFAFICAIIAYIGLIRFQVRLFRLGILSEARFVLFQIAILGFIFVLGSVAFLPTIKEQLIGIGITFLSMFAGIPAARRFYRKVLRHRS